MIMRPEFARHLRQLLLVVAASLPLLVLSCARAPFASKEDLREGEWHDFQGTWTAVGSRNSLPLTAVRIASISTFSGSLMLSGPSRPGIGFRSEAIVFSDTTTGLVGRAVWTDENGDRIYSELRGVGTATQNRITGTFIGGTGRYSGATGTYEFGWQFVIENDDGTVQGQSVGLSGRVRVDARQAGSGRGGSQS